MSKKLMAVLAVLLMIATPFFAICECEGGGESEAGTSNGNFTLLDLINEEKGTPSHWIKSSTNGAVVTLANNPDYTHKEGDATTLVLDEVEEPQIDKVVTTSLIVPNYASIRCNVYDIEVSTEITINGTVGTDEEAYDIGVVIGTNAKISGNGIIKASIKVPNDVAVTIPALTIACTENTTITVGENSKITFDGTVVRTSNQIEIVMKNGNVFKFVNGAKITDFWTDKFTMGSLSTDDFTISYGTSENDAGTCTFSGTVDGTGANSHIKTRSQDENNYIFDNLNLSKTKIIFDSGIKNIIFKNNNTIVDYSDTTLSGYDDENVSLMRASAGTELIVKFSDTNGNPLYFYADEKGLTPCFVVNAERTHGIASIDETKSIRFVKAGGTINLNEIAVTCESGYKFAGWYYMDENGILCPISNPAEFVATGNMKVYAVADKEDPVIPDPPTPVTPESRDYTVWFVVLVIMTALLMVMMAFTHYTARQNAVKAAPATKRTSTRKTRTKKK